MLSEVFVHLEHTDLVLATEDRPELVIGKDLALVLGVLEVIRFDVLPNLAHHFGAGQGSRADNVLCGEAAAALGQQISARRFAGSALQSE